MAFEINAKRSREETATGAGMGALQGAGAGAAMGATLGGGYGAAIGAVVGGVAGGIRGGVTSNVQDRKAQKDAYTAEQRRLRLQKQAEFDAAAYAQNAPSPTGPSVESMGTPTASASDAWRKQVYG